MFDKFGELDSAKEMNELAQNLFNEGDIESIRALAKENGIEGWTVDNYVEGYEPVFVEPDEAAIGKIEVEAADLKPKDIMVDWVNYIKTQCMEDEDLAVAVRRKDKSLKACIGEILKWAFSHQQDVDQDIVKAAGVKASKITLGMPGRAEAQKIIREYYVGAKK